MLNLPNIKTQAAEIISDITKEDFEQWNTLDEILSYDKYVLAFSGGKDSLACFLHLLDIGIPKEKIELHHHDIDGHGQTLMDWECTPDYCRKIAEAFGVPIYFSWKEGGFEREMLRKKKPTAPMWYETPDGRKTSGGKRGKGTRLKFPQVSPDLSVRWCSAYLKIDVMKAAINNQERFRGIKTLVISGERAEESANRANYADFEIDRSDLRNGRKYQRHVDRWRPIRKWTEQQVWNIIKKYKVNPHPAYYLGWGRVSCKFCIFGSANQFASAMKISPVEGRKLVDYEKQFGVSIKRNEFLTELIAKGVPYEMDERWICAALSRHYTEPVFIENWVLPKGAISGEKCGSV